MSAVAGVILGVSLLVVIAATVVTYHGLGKVWHGVPRERRRRHLIIEAAGFSVGSVLAVLGIVALWGPDTAAYELLGIGVIAILCALVGAAGAARQDLRTAPKRGADHR